MPIQLNNIGIGISTGSKENINTKEQKMFDDENELYFKYMAFNKIMLEDYEALEVAAIMVIQGLSFYKSVMSDEDYQRIVKTIYDKRDSVHVFDTK